jgi:Rieske Fe-S protein
MGVGLVAGYGAFGTIAVRYLYPAGPAKKSWLFAADASRLARGDSLVFVTPTGSTVAVARQGDRGTVEDFVALSSTCPHLGCKVHWESQNDRFFCPCHNGTFDRNGKGTGGPPGEAGQSLERYPLRLEGNLLFIEVPTEGIVPEESGPALSRGGE